MSDWIKHFTIDNNIIFSVRKEIDECLEKNNIVADNKNYLSTTGTNSYQYKLNNFVQNISSIEQIKQITENFLKKNDIIDNKESLKIMSCWTVIGYDASYHRLHRHNNYQIKHFSTVIYLDCIKSKNVYSGCFYAVLKKNNEMKDIVFQPTIGDALVFPVWILHGTYPQDSYRRQTLNIDYSVV
jgi:hypothetical protein